MRAFEVIPSETNRPRSRLQPKRRGAALIQKDSEYIPGDPDVVAAKVNRFGFAGWSFKRSVHIFVPGMGFSRNCMALLSASPRLVVFETPKPIRAAVAKEVGVKNPAEKTAVRPNQKLKSANRLHSHRNGIRFHPHNRPGQGRRLPRTISR